MIAQLATLSDGKTLQFLLKYIVHKPLMTDFGLVAQLNGSAESIQVVVLYHAKVVQLRGLLLFDRRRFLSISEGMAHRRYCGTDRPLGPLAKRHIGSRLSISSRSSIVKESAGRGEGPVDAVCSLNGIPKVKPNTELPARALSQSSSHEKRRRKTIAIMYVSKSKQAELTPVCEASDTPLLRTLGAGVAAPKGLSGYSAALSMRVFRCLGSGSCETVRRLSLVMVVRPWP